MHKIALTTWPAGHSFNAPHSPDLFAALMTTHAGRPRHECCHFRRNSICWRGERKFSRNSRSLAQSGVDITRGPLRRWRVSPLLWRAKSVITDTTHLDQSPSKSPLCTSLHALLHAKADELVVFARTGCLPHKSSDGSSVPYAFPFPHFAHTLRYLPLSMSICAPNINPEQLGAWHVRPAVSLFVVSFSR